MFPLLGNERYVDTSCAICDGPLTLSEGFVRRMGEARQPVICASCVGQRGSRSSARVAWGSAAAGHLRELRGAARGGAEAARGGWQVIDNCTYMHGIWYVHSRDNSGDWLAQLGKAGGKWVLQYRFRYYADDKSVGSEDKKNWVEARAEDDSDASRDKMLGALKVLLPLIEVRYGVRHEFVDLQCAPSDPKFMFELAMRPWCHMKRLTKKEMEKEGITP